MLHVLRILLSEFQLGLDKWEEVLELIQYILNHLLRKPLLGNRCAVHVITGQEPDTALEMALWMGKKLKGAEQVIVAVEMVEKHCLQLAKAVETMHEQIRDENLREARKKAAREARNKTGGALHFYVGEYVMVAAQGTSANVIRKSKAINGNVASKGHMWWCSGRTRPSTTLN